MGHLPVLVVILLQPAIVWTQATAPAATGAATNPLLSLNVPNVGNLLGGLLGGIGLGGAMANGFGNMGGGFGNMGGGSGLGFGNMLGLFNHHNNLFFNQLLFNGLLGAAFLKFTALILILGAFLAGGFLIKFLGIAAIVSLIKWSPNHGHYRRSSTGFLSKSQPLESWPHLHPSDNSFMWEERRSRHFRSK